MLLRTSFLVGLVMLLVGCDSPNPNIAPRITNNAEYQRYAVEVQGLSKPIIEQFYIGDEPTDQDKLALAKALPIFRGLLAYDARQMGNYFGLGQCLVVSGNNEEGIRYLQTGLNYASDPLNDKDRPLVAETLNLISIASFNIQLYQQAFLAANSASGFYPKSAAYLESEANALLQLDRIDEARDRIKKALGIDPNSKKARQLMRMLQD